MKIQKINPLPRSDPDNLQTDEPPLASAAWISKEIVLSTIKSTNQENLRNPIFVGQLWDNGKQHLFSVDDDRHMISFAGSRAGKGVSLVIPNLLSYPGSVVCVDPKGENSAVTAGYRADALKQRVVILDPFGTVADIPHVQYLRGNYNPLQFISEDPRLAIDEVSALSESIVIQDNDKDPHWNESARTVLKGVVLLLMSLVPFTDQETGAVNWTLDRVQQFIANGLPTPDDPYGPTSLDGLIAVMKSVDSYNGIVASAGHLLDQMAAGERGSVLSTLRRHMEFLESPPLRDNIQSSSFDPRDIPGGGMTLYLVLPEWLLNTHARWLRIVLVSIMTCFQKRKSVRRSIPTMFILDEFATLGYMQSIERAAGYIAGFGVKLWFILQDINQLKSLYKNRWETFLGNAGTLTAFGNVDATTCEYISRRLGETEIARTTISQGFQQSQGSSRRGLSHIIESILKRTITGAWFGNDSVNKQDIISMNSQTGLHKTALITPDEVARFFSRESETILVHIAGHQPLRLNRIRYFQDEPFNSRGMMNPFHL